MGMTSTMTTTATATALQQTPSCIHLPSESSACAQLRADYQLAAGAFLRKDFARTHALVDAALARIPPGAGADAYAVHRRQWAVLRNTLLTTVHGAHAKDKDLPLALRDAAALPGPALAAELRTACAHLFAGRPPAPVAHTLAVAALRLGAPAAARDAVEEWLAHREDEEDGEGHAKLVEVYVLHVLPRLGEWEYAREFLEYEREMPAERREAMKAELATAHAKHLAQTSTPAPSVPPSPTISTGPSRSPSPAPSTTSSQTARPARRPASALTPLSSPTTPTARGRAPRRHPARPTTIPERASEHTAPALPPPSSLALAAAGLRRWLRNAPGLAALCVLVALLSLVRRVRRSGARKAPGMGAGAVIGLWRELVRAVGDTVTMAGRGLV